MKDYLLDIVRNTAWLGSDFEIRVTGTDGKNTQLSGYNDNTVIMLAELNKEVKDFEGVFGLRNLNMLSGLLNMDSFKSDKATVSMKHDTRNDVIFPVEIMFNSPDINSTYRLMAQMALKKEVTMAREPEYKVIVDQPKRQTIQDFHTLSGIYSSTGSDSFTVKTENDNVVLCIGDDNTSSHKAKFVFAQANGGELNTTKVWNVANFINVMKLSSGADCTVRFANEMISVVIDTSLCKYNFLLLGQSV